MTCPRTAKWFGACRFEARYDEPVLSDDEKILGRQQWIKVEGSTKLTWGNVPLGQRTYIHDICTRCGKVVERTKEGK